MLPLVSVIMPSYNGGKYIGQAIESILMQSYDDFELIIIEDCSTDNSAKIIEQYMKRDNRIKCFVNERNNGIAYSTNIGLKMAKGKYIALLDDDDLATEERLRLQVNCLESNPDIDILGGRTIEIDENGDLVRDWGTPRNNPRMIKAKLLFENVDFGNSSVMIRKDFLENNNLEYREGCLGMQDFRFFMESSKVGNISSIDEILLKHRIHRSCETEHVKEFFSDERARIYAVIQRDSLERSGYRLSEEEKYILNSVLRENQIVGNTCKDWTSLYKVFEKILIQAQEMKVDYYPELFLLCKRKMRTFYNRIDLFCDI